MSSENLADLASPSAFSDSSSSSSSTFSSSCSTSPVSFSSSSSISVPESKEKDNISTVAIAEKHGSSSPPSSSHWDICPHLRILLLGTISRTSPLCKLRGLSSTIIKAIFEEHVVAGWRQNICMATPNLNGKRWFNYYLDKAEPGNNMSPSEPIPFLRLNGLTVGRGAIQFPKFTGININMMPFKMGEKESLPKEYRPYWPLLQACQSTRDHGRIGYLTIHETDVPKGTSQRRAGMHTESPGMLKIGLRVMPIGWGAGEVIVMTKAGRGNMNVSMTGGIYMASNVANTCMVWPCVVNNLPEVVGEFGDCEHLRRLCGKGETLEANELVWMTDATPHESLPLPNGGRRQYFRLVAGGITVWYAHHSTPNPLGIQPDAIVLTNDKFSDEPNTVTANSPIPATKSGVFSQLKSRAKRG